MYNIYMSRVVVVKYTGAAGDKFLERDQYRMLLDAAVKTLAGTDDFRAYLKGLFPKGAVGMKTNCLARFNPTLLPLVDALSELLMASAGVAENDIVVWERGNRELSNAGFKLNASSFGRRCLGTDTNGVGYDDSQFYSFGRVNSLVTSILTRLVDHSINLGVLKHHSIAGMSAGLKNMYGAVNNPNKYHANNCSPFAAEISGLEPIRTKHRLTIIDAIRVQCDKGPAFDAASMVAYNGLVVSQDPIAVDRIALEILQHLRELKGLPPLAKVGREVKYLTAGEQAGLGVNTRSQIDLQVRTVDANGVVSVGELF